MTNSSENFIEQIIEEDLKNGLSRDSLRFRFPPEPNGYLHIGHTKAIGVSFGLGDKYKAPVNLRFDDTNPAKEDQRYVDAIKKDISWLGYTWDKECYSSDYFNQLFEWAVLMIENNKAYVDSQTSEEIAEQKGTPTEPGVNSPFRERTVEENLSLFSKMRRGVFKAGEHVLRAKIDMKHQNMLMRDPLMYRIIHASHQRTGNDWCIYPMYDWAHGESDYIEQISHSLCSLEFKPHRDLYDWFKNCVFSYSKHEYSTQPKQREFARLNLSHTIMSKRKLLKLVEGGFVDGWDDPRMPTISGLRRRGYTANAIKKFVKTIGVAKRNNIIDASLLEFCVREDLNKKANRVMAVLNPVRLTIINYEENKTEWLDAENNPEDERAGSRSIPFSRNLFIEREDFKEHATNKYFRLAIGKEVRLKNAFIIKAEAFSKDKNGEITEVLCTYDPESLSGSGTAQSNRKVKGTLHWVSINHSKEIEVREYDRLFSHPAPEAQDGELTSFLNPESLKTKKGYIEPSIFKARDTEHYQFQRLGYFCVDPDSTHTKMVFNKTVSLRDSWSKPEKKQMIGKRSNEKPKRPPIEIIKKIGKKYMSLSAERQESAKSEIKSLSGVISYQELLPLFNTSRKKTGTRLVVIVVLKELLHLGQPKTKEIKDFIEVAAKDDNEKLKKAALEIA